MRAEAVVLAVLVTLFLTRSFLAGWNSYWYDELLSVNVYGQWHDSAFEAVRHLAAHSVHPPLYQWLLYHWIGLFGDGEVATRTLSNLYVTIAALVLYLMMRDVFGRRIALASAATFSITYSVIYYGTETRSYAQTIMLVTLSSHLLLRLMHHIGDRGWGAAVLSRTTVVFVVTNVALLLTHYYNVFWWIAQAVMATAFVLRQRGARQRASGVGVLISIYALQLVVFALVWGRVLFDQLDHLSDGWLVEGGPETPLGLLRLAVLQPNLPSPRWVKLIGLALLVLLLARTAVTLASDRELTVERRRAWTSWYLVGWMLLPLVVVSLAFLIIGVERYSTRYFLFSVVPLAPLLVLAVEEALRWSRRALRRTGRALARWTAGVATAAVAAAFVLPGGYEAATNEKYAWGSTVRQVVNVVGRDPDHQYVIFELSPWQQPLTQFYFERYSGDVRAHETTYLREHEQQGDLKLLTEHGNLIAEHDYLVLVFVHSRTTEYPDTLDALEDRHEVHHKQLDHMGRGFIIYSVSG